MRRSGSGMPVVSRKASNLVSSSAAGSTAPLSAASATARAAARISCLRAVVESDDESEPAVVAREVFRLAEKAGDIRRQAVPRADEAHLDGARVQIGEIAANEDAQQAEEIADFLHRPAPVLGGKAVDREPADIELDRGTHGAPQRLDATPMPLEPRQAALRGPAAIAVHDDRHMARDVLGFVARNVVLHGGSVPFHRKPLNENPDRDTRGTRAEYADGPASTTGHHLPKARSRRSLAPIDLAHKGR